MSYSVLPKNMSKRKNYTETSTEESSEYTSESSVDESSTEESSVEEVVLPPKILATKAKLPKIKVRNDDDIRNLCIIRINDDFSYGNYGVFQVIIKNDNGFMNATKLCKDGGKEFRNWKANANAKELISAVSSSARIPADGILQTITGGKNVVIRGTYVHPDLIPHIASWVSPEFAIKVSKIVNEYFIKKASEEKDKLLHKKDDKIDRLTKEIRKQTEMIHVQTRKSDEQARKNDKQYKKISKMDNRIKRLLVKNDGLRDQNDEILGKIWKQHETVKDSSLITNFMKNTELQDNDEMFYIKD